MPLGTRAKDLTVTLEPERVSVVHNGLARSLVDLNFWYVIIISRDNVAEVDVTASPREPHSW
jgi:hypothetical protein